MTNISGMSKYMNSKKGNKLHRLGWFHFNNQIISHLHILQLSPDDGDRMFL
jgi:hypothetical protein